MKNSLHFLFSSYTVVYIPSSVGFIIIKDWESGRFMMSRCLPSIQAIGRTEVGSILSGVRYLIGMDHKSASSSSVKL